MAERDYLVARAAQERKFASAATDERAATIHAAMAAEYERRLIELETRRQRRSIIGKRRRCSAEDRVQTAASRIPDGPSP